jgi:hypothetical protein
VDYPSTPNSSSIIFHTNTAEETVVTYVFGSSTAATTDVAPGDLFTITDLGANLVRVQFPTTATVANINIGDVLSVAEDCGFSAANTGRFSIVNKNDIDKTVDIYNPNAQFTAIGVSGVQQIECICD